MNVKLDREQQIQQSWEANAGAWIEAIDRNEIESRRATTDRAILEAVLRCKPRQVLDVGCGEGWLARALTDRGVEVLGIDSSRALVDRAIELGGGVFGAIAYDRIIADPAILGQPYDAIVCNFSLFGEEIGDLLRSLRQATVSDGHLLIQTVHPFAACQQHPYIDGWQIETFDNFGGDFKAPMPWYFRTVSSWFKQLSASGWNVCELEEPIHPQTKIPLSLLLTCH
ncbi:MAG: class I SAM-dependent methyltransferase [Richelia sp. CSU_2_1]|nr:class I SAM-dependent methyltransferase [Microcoleus sp. SU_5_6]NJL68398.1 class I SAM-dependent methyltransferase [Microcoleus sp. SM1_3_4]NJR22687.1 class I SAM-dependent methyltransferase [Richelia sp. CSU_2_1]